MASDQENQNVYDDSEFFANYYQLRNEKYNLNNAIETPYFNKLIPELTNKSVLDLGCGYGKSSADCIKAGAKKVVAIDSSQRMIRFAKENYTPPDIAFNICPIEHYEFPEATFDVVLSSLCFHYIEDFTKLIQNIKKTLVPGGTLLFSQEHPYAMANKDVLGWEVDSEGNKKHWILDHYHEEGERIHDWFAKDVVKYHRTLQTIVNTLIESGFILEHIGEPYALPNFEKEVPELKEHRRRPPFLFIRCRNS